MLKRSGATEATRLILYHLLSTRDKIVSMVRQIA